MYTIGIMVKPYVKKFLEHKFGSPVDFTSLNSTIRGTHFYTYVRKSLTNPNLCRGDKKERVDNYFNNSNIVEVRICISAFLFYKYGWEISPIDQIHFNSYVESYIKELVYYSIEISRMYEDKISTGISNFRKISNLTEDDFSYDAIKQFLYRENVRKKSLHSVTKKT